MSSARIAPPFPNLFLVGFMGTGKSSLGRALARRWRCPFKDTDHLIEKKIQMPIRDFFAQKGEATFRELERECVEKWIPAEGAVISCGGGLIVPPGMIELLKSKGVLVCLFASPETILRRTQSTTHRPLLQAEDPAARIRELMTQRESAYLRAGTSVLTDGRNFLDLAIAVERIYRREIALRRKAK